MGDVAVIKFAKVKENAKIPTRVEGSAGMDVYACFDENQDYICIPPHETKLIPTGLKTAVDPEHFIFLAERGSTGSKGMKRGAGVVDADYRGEIFVCITNENTKPIYISRLDEETTQKIAAGPYIYYSYFKAIAQILILPTPTLDVEEITPEELMSIPSLRGTGALGSSGK